MRVAILANVTGWPEGQWREFVSSAKSMFLSSHEHHFFILADSVAPREIPQEVTWYVDSEKHHHTQSTPCTISAIPAEILAQYDFVCSLNALLKFRRPIGTEFLPDSPQKLVVVQHPSYVNLPPNRLPFERNPRSRAFVAHGQGLVYVTDQVIGGAPAAYSAMIESIQRNLQSDYRDGVVSERLYESHLNRYVMDHPHVIRHAGYCYPGGWDLGVPRMMESDTGQTMSTTESRWKTKSQIIVRLDGDLGNQLFQYANGLAMSEKTGGRLLLDTQYFDRNHQHHYQLGQFNIRADIACRKMLPLQKHFSLRRFLPGRLGRLYESTCESDLQIIDEQNYVRCRHSLHHPGRFYLQGQWHHQIHFQKHQQKLRDELQWLEPMDSARTALLESMQDSPSLAVDLNSKTRVPISEWQSQQEKRWRDYVDDSIDRVHQISNKRPKLFVFSDNISWAQRILSKHSEIQFVQTDPQGPQFDSLRLLSACRYQIISNSKLAWWAAWLGHCSDKLIVIPSTELAESIWGDSLPVLEGWHEMDVPADQIRVAKAA